MKFPAYLDWMVTFFVAAVVALVAVARDITRPRRFEVVAACCFGLAVCFVVLPGPAWAADGTTVSLPIGDWIDAIAKPAIDILTAALITMATWVMAKAPAPIAALIKTPVSTTIRLSKLIHQLRDLVVGQHGCRLGHLRRKRLRAVLRVPLGGLLPPLPDVGQLFHVVPGHHVRHRAPPAGHGDGFALRAVDQFAKTALGFHGSDRQHEKTYEIAILRILW